MITYRNNGAIGALLDEYERALIELKNVIFNLSDEQLTYVVDPSTDDPDCRSIQTILTHVVQSGYTYVIEIRKWLGETIEYRDKTPQSSSSQFIKELDNMFTYTVALFKENPTIQMIEKDPAKKILVRWGPRFDVDQLMEHAVMHILRHRRQIERFMQEL